MNQSYRGSFIIILALVFLLPIFFIPSVALPTLLSKAALIAGGAIIAFLALLIDSFRNERFVFPSHSILWMAAILPVVYLVSALFSSKPELSLFGYGLESGTASSMLILFALFAIVAIIFRDRDRLVRGYAAFLLSAAILALFALIKVFFGGDVLVLKNFPGNMGNPVGAWTDYAVVFGLVAVLTAFSMEMLHLKGAFKWLAYALFAVSSFMLMVTNFATAWGIVLAASVVLLIYFITVEKMPSVDGEKRARPGVIAFSILIALSLLFVFNPVVSSTRGGISNLVASVFGVDNVDIRPSFGATMQVSRSAIRENPIVGPGPNTFAKSWLLYKPAALNNSPYWNVVFPYGVGFIPTQFASVGILGILAWVTFFLLFISLGLKAFYKSAAERHDRFLVIASFFASLFLWIASLFYAPSLTVLALTFVFTGFFVASAGATGIIGERSIAFGKSALAHFTAVLVLIALAVGTAAFALVGYQKISSVAHFQRALAISNEAGTPIADIETELAKAINLSEADPFWRGFSQIEIAKANAAVNNASSTPEENSAAFQDAISKSIAYAQNAITKNPSYQNWTALGDIYASLVPEPFSVQGAYDNAIAAYKSAEALNPKSPEVALLMARLEISNKNTEAARAHIDEAIARKADYADAYFTLSQLEVGESNLPKAIESAETGVLLLPGNAGVLLQLGLLKYANKDYTGAANAFQRALVIEPQYANAKYYLGLSYDSLGKKAEAIKEFEDLAKTNPDNALVAQVLSNLRANKPALSGTESDSDAAPISGQ